MRVATQSRWSAHTGIALLLILSALLGAVYIGVAHPGSSSSNASGAHPYAVYVREGESPVGKTTASTFACQAATAPVRCYSPQQIRAAYDVTSLLNKGITGTGRTIVIIDAYQSPTIVADLHTFDQIFGLPDPKLNIIAPDGLTPFDYTDPNQVGWAGEITLDVEWSHAIAPGATIDLVLAKSNNDPDILSATSYAVHHNLGDVISQSFGEGEACSGVPLSAQHAVFEQALREGTTVFASSGDEGAAQASQTTPVACGGSEPYYKSASTPASDPAVTGVGATSLNANAQTGAYISESAWNDEFGASGGGYSSVFARPAFQNQVVRNRARGVPDVAYNGDVNGGVLTVWSSYAAGAPQLVYIFGGTSAGSPQWAAITALGDQLAGRRLGFLNDALYQIGTSKAYTRAFHDTTAGNNTFTTTDNNGNPLVITGYNTTPGWDAVTGWGSPDVAHLLPLLVTAKCG